MEDCHHVLALLLPRGPVRLGAGHFTAEKGVSVNLSLNTCFRAVPIDQVQAGPDGEVQRVFVEEEGAICVHHK